MKLAFGIIICRDFNYVEKCYEKYVLNSDDDLRIIMISYNNNSEYLYDTFKYSKYFTYIFL